MFAVISYKLIIFAVSIMGIALLLVYLYYNGSANQFSFGQLRQLPDATAADRVLVFSPHPDDETAAVGGYIYSAQKKDAAVRIVLATDGNQLGLGKQRYREIISSLGRLGIPARQLCCLGHPDTKLSRHRSALRKEIAREIKDFQPNIIVCPSPDDLHSDHRVLGNEVLDVVLAIKPSAWIFTYLVHYPWWPQMRILAGKHYLMPPRRLAGKRDWICFPLTEAAFCAKTDALSLYKTQLFNPFIRPKLLRLMQSNELFEVIKISPS